MDLQPLITASDDESEPWTEEFQNQLPQPLRGPSLDDVVDLGVSVRETDGTGNAYAGIEFRGEETLITNVRLDNLKEYSLPNRTGEEDDLTHIKMVHPPLIINDNETSLKCPVVNSVSLSSERERYSQSPEGASNSGNCEGTRHYEETLGSLTSTDLSSIYTTPVRPRTGIAPHLTEGKKYHAFFSYEISDRDWVEEVTRRLESPEFGFRCSIHERDFHGGKRIIENITEHIRISEKTVLVLSPDFIHSHWCMFEIELGMVLSMEESQLLVVPVMVKQCEVPDSIKTLTYIDATAGNDWWQRFLEAITAKDSLLSDFSNTKDFTIRPRYGNMDFLTETSSRFGDLLRVPYIPAVLTTTGIQMTAEEFHKSFDHIRSSSRWFCACLCDIAPFTVTLFLLLLGFGAVLPIWIWSIYGRGDAVDAYHNELTALFTVLGFLWILMAILFFTQRALRKKRLKRAVMEANRDCLKNNVVLGFKAEASACILFRIKISFWYYNMSECQSHLAEYLQASEGIQVNADSREIAQAQAKMLIYRHSEDYTCAYADGKLTPIKGTRHVRNAYCMCQFIEDECAGGTKFPKLSSAS